MADRPRIDVRNRSAGPLDGVAQDIVDARSKQGKVATWRHNEPLSIARDQVRGIERVKLTKEEEARYKHMVKDGALTFGDLYLGEEPLEQRECRDVIESDKADLVDNKDFENALRTSMESSGISKAALVGESDVMQARKEGGIVTPVK